MSVVKHLAANEPDISLGELMETGKTKRRVNIGHIVTGLQKHDP